MQQEPYSNEQTSVSHTPRMEPRKLLKELMQRSQDNSNSLAVKLRGKTTQPQIYKFVEGKVREPRRSTLQPIADHYGIPIDAFYSEEIAQIEYDKLMGVGVTFTGKAPEETPEIKTVVKNMDFIEAKGADRYRRMGLESMRWSEATDGLVDDALFKLLPRGWDLQREMSDKNADFTVLDQNGVLVCGIEVKRFPQHGHRVTDRSRLDQLMGFLWRNSVDNAQLRPALPMAVVAIVENDEQMENPVEIVSNELVKALILAKDNGILTEYAIVGLKRIPHLDNPHYDLMLYDVEYHYGSLFMRSTMSLMMERIRQAYTSSHK